MLGDYAGTVLLVSHDRDFLDRVCTSVINAEGDGQWIDYAGGYSDMLAQRGPIVAAPVAARARQAPSPAQATAGPARKLSFKDRHALETLPGQIERLQATIGKLRGALADPDLYRRDAALFQRATTALANAETELAQAEDRWLELEILREEMEAR